MESEGVFGAQKVGMEGEGEMEVEEQEGGEPAARDSAQQLLGSEVSMSVPTMTPVQHDAQDSELEKDEEKRSEEKENKKVDETSAPFRLTSPTTFPPRRKPIFSEVPPPESLKSPSKPQVSVLTTGPKCSEDIAMEIDASTAMAESKHKGVKELKVLEKEAPKQSLKPAEASKKALKSPHATKKGEIDKTRESSLREKSPGRRALSSQSSSSDTDSESSSSHSSSSPSQEKSSPPIRKKVSIYTSVNTRPI